MRQGHDATAWCYVSGWVSVLETQLLGEEIYRTLLEGNAPGTVWGVLSKTGYRPYFDGPEALHHFEQGVQRFSLEQRAAIQALCPEPNPVAFFDFDRRYRAARARWTGMQGEEDPETAPPHSVDAFLRAFPEIGYPAFVDEYVPVFAAALGGERGRGRLTQGISRTAFSNLLDSLYLSLLLAWGHQWSEDLIQEYVERYVRFKLVEVVLRSVRRGMDVGQLDRYLFLGPLRTDEVARLLEREEYPDVLELVEVLLPSGFSLQAGEVDSSLEAFQRAAERFLLGTIWPARYVVFGPEKIFGYLCGLRNQEANLQFCLSAALYGLDPGRIAERLRPTYV